LLLRVLPVYLQRCAILNFYFTCEGSAYAYAYGTIVKFRLIIGWGLILEYAMGSMTVAVSWSGYFNKMLKMFGIKHLSGYH
jgi:APA family basic amino acid/polyamine antiporter